MCIRDSAIGGGEFPVLIELIGVWFFVNPIDIWLVAPLEVARHEFVGQEHQFLDELMRDVIFDQFQPDGTTIGIKPDLDLGHFQICLLYTSRCV